MLNCLRVTGWLGLLVALPLSATAERFQLATRSLNIPERGEVTECVILLDTNQVSFMAPPDWHVRLTAPEKKVTLNQLDGGALLTLRVVVEPSGKTPRLQRAAWRQRTQTHLPQAKMIEEFTCYGGGVPGIAFDLQEPAAADHPPLSLRQVFLPVPGYLIELEIVAPSPQFQSLHPLLVNFLNSLRCEPLK